MVRAGIRQLLETGDLQVIAEAGMEKRLKPSSKHKPDVAV
jgi:DNA-binding NarL/FixJ family response regulator